MLGGEGDTFRCGHTQNLMVPRRQPRGLFRGAGEKNLGWRGNWDSAPSDGQVSSEGVEVP